jgi:hypothetical protein
MVPGVEEEGESEPSPREVGSQQRSSVNGGLRDVGIYVCKNEEDQYVNMYSLKIKRRSEFYTGWSFKNPATVGMIG